MRRFVFALIVFSVVMTMAYYGCSGDDTGAGDGGGTDGSNNGGGDAESPDVGAGACEVKDSIVGKPCTTETETTDCLGVANTQCLTNEFCNTITGGTTCEVPGGYCFKFIMGDTVEGTCGPGAWWLDAKTIDPNTAAWVCVKCCASDDDCRKAEGYWCYYDAVTNRGGCVPNDFHEVLNSDGGMPHPDGGTPADTGTPVDSGTPADGGTPVDGGTPEDTGSGGDA